MAFGRRVQPVERVAGRINGSIETERNVRTADVIVDSLGDAHDRNAFFIDLFGNAHRTVTANDDQRVEAEFVEISNHHVGDIGFDGFSAFSDRSIRERVGAVRCAQNRAAQMKNSRDTRIRQCPGLTMDQAIEALFNSEDFPAEADAGFDGRPNDGIQCRAVSATGKDANSHKRRHFS